MCVRVNPTSCRDMKVMRQMGSKNIRKTSNKLCKIILRVSWTLADFIRAVRVEDIIFLSENLR